MKLKHRERRLELSWIRANSKDMNVIQKALDNYHLYIVTKSLNISVRHALKMAKHCTDKKLVAEKWDNFQIFI